MLVAPPIEAKKEEKPYHVHEVPVSCSGFKAKVVAPTKMKEEVAVEHDPNKGRPDQHVKPVEARGQVKCSPVYPVR